MYKVLKAPAKINLCLKVNGRMENGYHALTMIMQTISLFDTLEFEISKRKDSITDNQINIKCSNSFLPTDERNIVYKVAKYICEEFDINDRVFIKIKKMIPMGGGLGGGSSDAATTLLFLNKYYKLGLDYSKLSNIASKFGADIPFFIYGKECICRGFGERVERIEAFDNYYILLATPSSRVSTKIIFDRYDNTKVDLTENKVNGAQFHKCIEAIKKKDLNLLASNIFNNLESITIPIVPMITVLKEHMQKEGALKSMMTGSGSTVFGIFNSYFMALNCKNSIKKTYKDIFVYVARPLSK